MASRFSKWVVSQSVTTGFRYFSIGRHNLCSVATTYVQLLLNACLVTHLDNTKQPFHFPDKSVNELLLGLHFPFGDFYCRCKYDKDH